ncbi:hypothetical protein PG997_003582 [Apiospora hydei]|uniref:Beta-lactamase-related domain-containing protein n=1 Tax=Apiospora hydei TaxID=1337664 RepID=A0ABR1WZR2_9PEZI
MLISYSKTVALASLCLSGVSSRFLGPMDPAPVDISGKDSIYHHTGPDVRNSSNGVRTVNGDSIYRVASLTKLFTVFAGLLELKPQDWNLPLDEVFPEIAGLPNDDPIRHIDWHSVTPLNLASQISGVPRDGLPFSLGEFWYTLMGLTGKPPVDPTTLGLPPISVEEANAAVPCKGYNCSVVDYIKGLQGPTFLPWQTPGYADTGFILLGQAISRLTNMTLEEYYRKAVLDPLGMAKTTATAPTEKGFPGYVVVAPLKDFALDGGITRASGGVFSTTNDLAKLGIGILNSTLLPADQTRKWMKPSTFTAHSEFAQGMGWEIYRYTHRDTGHITDMYTKLGDAGSYSSYLVLIPDYDAGFSVIQASGIAGPAARSAATQLLADIVSEAILPALQTQAAVEAKRNFAGTYTDGKNSSSLTLAYNQTASNGAGLTLVSFTSDGHDMMAQLAAQLGSMSLVLQPAIAAPRPVRQLSFQATPVVDPADEGAATGLFSKQFAVNSDWIRNNGATYGGQGFGTFIFNVSGQGEATAVTPAFLRKIYRKQD